MAKKKTDEDAQQAAAAQAQMQPGMMPGMPMPGMQPGMMPGMQPGMMPGMMQAGMGGNPMMQMMQMMQMMMGGGAAPGMAMDPSAIPFAATSTVSDEDQGLDAEIIRPATFENLIKDQEAVPLGSVLDLLCLNSAGDKALGGVPKGCTMALIGPPGKGKTRTSLAALAKVAQTGTKVAYVVAEEGFHDAEGAGRDDLCSRMVKIGMVATELNEKKFRKQVLDNVFVLESQYHKGQTWDDFITKYRYLIESKEIRFVVIDSLNMLDPTKHRTADNLSALKTYNHEQGVTCVCIGQIRDTGLPVGGEALMHTADAVFFIEEMSLGSKEIAAQWGGKYRDKISIIRAIKSVTTPIFPHPIRVTFSEDIGIMAVHEAQPEEYAPLASE